VSVQPGIGSEIVGAIRAFGWAVRFYAHHSWPLLALAAVPAIVRGMMALRSRHQMVADHTSEALEALVAVWRGALMLVIAGLDLLPDMPWWESMWPGAWAAQMGGRLNAMSGRGPEWIGLCFWVAIVVVIFALVLRSLTGPSLLTSVLMSTGMPRQKATRRAEAIGFTVGNLITIPLTTLLLYAAVARAALCLRR
jgi:hypothetical protein